MQQLASLPDERGRQCDCRGESNPICDAHLMRAPPNGFNIHSAVLLLKKDLMTAVRCCRSIWPITCSVMRNPMVATAPRAKPIQNMQHPQVLTYGTRELRARRSKASRLFG